MKNFGLKRAFTIAELTAATIVIAGIAMILMPSLVSNNENHVLITSLTKTNTDLQQIYRSLTVLEAQGKLMINRGNMAGTFLNAVALTQKTIPHNKFSEYIYPTSTAPANTGIAEYTDWNNGAGNTIILKNTVYISQVDENTIVVDVNGRKLPNRTGKDIYFFYFTQIGAGYVNEGEIFFGGSCTDIDKDGKTGCNTIDETCTVGADQGGSGGCAAKYLKLGQIIPCK